jgi:hypothetical protein
VGRTRHVEGRQRDPDELARLWRGVRSGPASCKSDYGVYDLPGNADEVVASETTSNDFRGKFDSVHSGGPLVQGRAQPVPAKIYTHDEGFYYYFLSFRCCAEPTANRPSRARPSKSKRVEVRPRGAPGRFHARADERQAPAQSAGQMRLQRQRHPLQTMCGTLLGPNAKDAR